MTTTLVVFSHGKESGPWGRKIRRLADVAEAQGLSCLSLDYQGTALLDPEARVAKLLATPLPPHERLVLVGSSMGGYVSAVASAALRPAGLFLLAPALGLPGYAQADPPPQAGRTEIVHGWGDDVVPAQHSIDWARRHALTLHLLDGDHRLEAALPGIVPLFEQFLRAVNSLPVQT